MANTSQHLQALHAAGMVTRAREGTSVRYALAGHEALSVWLALRDASHQGNTSAWKPAARASARLEIPSQVSSRFRWDRTDWPVMSDSLGMCSFHSSSSRRWYSVTRSIKTRSGSGSLR
jgi:hypothetical protein